MTVATTGGNVPVGLEDIRATDLRVPRLKIRHADGVFVDPLTNVDYPKLTMVVLGAVRGRVKWNAVVESGDSPQCKSPDDEHGFPTINDELPKRLRFPWDESNFNLAEQTPDELGRIILPCAKCQFTKWGDNKKPPPCTEVMTLPVLYSPDGPDSDDWNVALWSCQKTSLRPAQNYISAFAQRRVPTFTAMCEVTLKTQSRGTNIYSVPSIRQLGATPVEDQEGFAQQYLMIRDYLRRFPGGGAVEEELPPASDNTNTPAPTAPAAAPSAPVATPPTATPPPTPEPAPVPPAAKPPLSTANSPIPDPGPPDDLDSKDDDDDLPF